MSRKRSSARLRASRQRRVERIGKFLLGNLVYVALGGAALLLAFTIVAFAQHIPPSNADNNGYGVPTPTTQWIRLPSKTPAGIIMAARQSALFNENRSGSGDYIKDLSHLENPVLVHALQVRGGVQMPDYYVIPIDNASGAMVGAAELELNANQTAIQVAAIITYPTPRPHGQMVRMSAQTAQTTAQVQHHIKMKAGTTPTLVYFPVDAALQQSGKIHWNGGGEYPADPIWLIAASNGQDQVVGTDGRVYSVSSLPFMRQS